jgi:hypothetical protein
MIQLLFLAPPLPPDFVPPTLNWFQFAMIYVAFVELILLALPKTWFCVLFRTAFPWMPKKLEEWNNHERKR